MGYNTHVTGEFRIEPPLEWPEFKESRFYEGGHRVDLALRVTEESVDTPNGILVRRQATHLYMIHQDEYRAYHLVEQVQEAVDSFPGHTWHGRLNCEGEETGDLWRVEISGGSAQRIDPLILWPGEKTHSEQAVARIHERIAGADGSEYCDLCSNHGDVHWPCATMRALGGLL
jgi:hypothetical protein